MRWGRGDAAILAIVFGLAGIWGGFFFARYIRTGGHPFFYQSYYEPAVMFACGKGFRVAERQPPPLRAFLTEQTDRFSCDQLPADLTVGTDHLYQRPWRYLMTMVGVAWMVLGISWSGLAPLYGLLFGATTALAYLLCRLIVGPVAAIGCVLALSLSRLQLSNLPNLRDYAKAPFTLALVLILVALVVWPWRPRTILLLALAYGVVMGVGYGFRTDLLVDIPPLLITVAFFLPGAIRRNGGVKIAAIALFSAAFLVAAWPIVRSVVGSGGCQWHFFLLGFTSPFNEALGVGGGAYDWGHLYRDEYMWTRVSSYAARSRPDLGYIEYCSREYDVASWEYLRQILVTFPADMVTRAYAAVLQVLNLPFARLDPLLAGRAFFPYLGGCLAAFFVLAISWSSLRLALFALFLILYLGGYPAIQFLPRHYFLFEFLGWTIIASLIEGGVRAVVARARERTAARRPLGPVGSSAGLQRMAIAALVAAVLLVLPLVVLRAYQDRRVTRLLESYINAPREPAPSLRIAAGEPRPRTTKDLGPGVSPDEPGRPVTRFVEASFDTSRCRTGTTAIFRYDPARPDIDFSRTVPLQRANGGAGLTRVFDATFDGFQGVDVSDPSPGCLREVAVVTHIDQLPLLLFAQLPPGWESQPQYERIIAR